MAANYFGDQLCGDSGPTTNTSFSLTGKLEAPRPAGLVPELVDKIEAMKQAEFELVVANTDVSVGNDGSNKLEVPEVSAVGEADTPKTLPTTAGEEELA